MRFSLAEEVTNLDCPTDTLTDCRRIGAVGHISPYIEQKRMCERLNFCSGSEADELAVIVFGERTQSAACGGSILLILGATKLVSLI